MPNPRFFRIRDRRCVGLPYLRPTTCMEEDLFRFRRQYVGLYNIIRVKRLVICSCAF